MTTEPVDRDYLLKLMRRNFAFLNFCGDEACSWLTELCTAEIVELRLKIFRGFKALRNHELEAGYALLSESDQDLRKLSVEFSSVLDYVERYQSTAMAYFYYANGNFEAAKASLSLGHEKIRRIISCHSFLVPVAAECTDFIIQSARIARRERMWREAERRIQEIRDIYLRRRPFCTLESGQPVGLDEISEFYSALPLSEEEREHIRTSSLDQDTPVSARIEQLEVQIFALPDMVIPYP